MVSVQSFPAGASASKQPRRFLLNILRYHAYTVYLFTCNDFHDIIFPGLVFGSLNALIAPKLSIGKALSFTEILQSVPAMVLWLWTHLLLACLSNQRHSSSIVEDSTDKPWRPLPSGRLTPEHATWLMYLMYPVLLIICSMVGGVLPSISLMFLLYCYNDIGGASSPWHKNLYNGVGIGCFLVGPLEVITGHSTLTRNASIWVALIMAAIASTSHIQDLRDVEGDTLSGRVTVPIAIGDVNARVAAVVATTAWTGLAAWYWEAGWVEASPAGLTCMMLVWNMIRDRTREGDKLSWKLWSVWLFGLFLTPVLKYESTRIAHQLPTSLG